MTTALRSTTVLLCSGRPPPAVTRVRAGQGGRPVDRWLAELPGLTESECSVMLQSKVSLVQLP